MLEAALTFLFTVQTIYEKNTLAGLVILLLYALPSLIAERRHHHQRHAISVATLLLGWTGIGWILALIWACTAVRQEHPLPPPRPYHRVSSD
jgi:Superinfection immunity protein